MEQSDSPFLGYLNVSLVGSLIDWGIGKYSSDRKRLESMTTSSKAPCQLSMSQVMSWKEYQCLADESYGFVNV